MAAITARAAILYFYPGGSGQYTETRDSEQARSFRDCYPQLLLKGYHLIGVHAQSAGHQLHHMIDGVEHILVADPELQLAATLRLPTYWDGAARAYCPLTLVVEQSRIIRTFHPVPAPALSGPRVLKWLDQSRPRGALIR